MENEKITALAGGYEGNEIGGREPFSEVVLDFLEELGEELRKDENTKGWQEAVSFAFWCRKKHLLKWKEEMEDGKKRMGRGLVFHVAPSNIPLLFAYSMVWGLLAGNGNIVRVSERVKEEASNFCRVLERVLMREKYNTLYKENKILCYGHLRTENDRFSSLCDARVVWGGDTSIREIRESPLPVSAISLEFADRTSIGIFHAGKMEEYTKEERENLAKRFYNDTYLMDQNACSSPKVIFWLEAQGREEVKRKWWETVAEFSEKYGPDLQRADSKYEEVSIAAMDMDELEKIRKYGNLLYLMQLSECKRPIEEYPAHFGTFYEVCANSLSEIAMKCGRKVQTVVYDGIDAEAMKAAILETGSKGCDRLVPIGSSLELERIWDGMDVIQSLSRIIMG